jgi:hypothetical protein
MMKHIPSLALAALLCAPAAHATIVWGDSADTAIETRWVQADSSSITVDTRDYTYLTLTSENGTVNGLRTGLYQYPPNTALELTAVPDPGHLFDGWEGAATGSANPLSLVMDFDKALTASFPRDGWDPDGDGLSNYEEIVVHQTNPDLWDTDSDGFGDGYEVNSGYDPKSATSSPDTQMVIYTAVEVEFGAGLGKTYRVESSIDLETWTVVESGIPGNGGTVTRLYSTRAIPARFFRAVRE